MSTLSSTRPGQRAGGRVDPRGQQFAAAITVVVLSAALLAAPHPAGLALLGIQGLVFAVGAGARRPAHPLRMGVPDAGAAATRASL